MIVQNPYLPLAAPVIEVLQETPTIRTLVLAPAEPVGFRSGQFVQLTLPGIGEAPFTPSSSPLEPARLEITILRTGTVTDRFHECGTGDVLGLRGPFGKGYPLDKIDGKEILVVGGGCGLAPLRALILAVLAEPERVKRMSIKYGARNMEELLYREQHARWAAVPNVDFTATIDVPQEGWDGPVGVVPKLLKASDIDRSNSLVFVCGPGVMLKFTTMALREEGFEPEQIYLSMNRRMSCGMGLCGRCNVGPYYLCKDGPDMK
ncbi:MAG: FAD/NAD(P)-binding protein, partial [Planctomycetes bacterium]|nr:FAD/NAD(P)-binding protein [Planctomycetota bacterium]